MSKQLTYKQRLINKEPNYSESNESQAQKINSRVEKAALKFQRYEIDVKTELVDAKNKLEYALDADDLNPETICKLTNSVKDWEFTLESIKKLKEELFPEEK